MNLRKKIAKTKIVDRRNPAVGAVLTAFFIFTALFFTSVANAGPSNVVSVPIIVSLPKDPVAIDESIIELANSTFQKGFEWDQTLTDAEIKDPFPVKLQGIQLRARVSGRLDRDAKGLIIEAKLQNPRILVDRISIHTVIETRVSGVDARVRIDAECANTEVTWGDQTIAFFARARVLTNPQLTLDVASSALPADLPRPEMKLSCTGPYGMDAAIREYAWSALQERWLEDSFARDLETQIEQSFSEAVKPGGSAFSLLSGAKFKMDMRSTHYEVASNGTHLYGTLDVSLDRPILYRAPALSHLNPPSSDFGKITFTVGASSLQSLVQEWFAPGIWSEWIEARSLEGFRDLMSSRLKQFFVFPDLMNYEKDAPFWFAASMSEKPTLRCSGSVLEVNAPIAAGLLLKTPPSAEYAMGYKPLVHFSLPTQIAVGLPSVQGRKALTMSLRSMSLGARFDARYIERENPNTSIGLDTILGSLEDSVGEILKNPSSLGEGVGSLMELFNQTNVSCGSDQMLRVSF